jgi:hypothetical protein
MNFQVTARYGGKYQRYHTYLVDASDAKAALQSAAAELPDEIAPLTDLIEIRVAVDPEKRNYVDEGGGGS